MAAASSPSSLEILSEAQFERNGFAVPLISPLWLQRNCLFSFDDQFFGFEDNFCPNRLSMYVDRIQTLLKYDLHVFWVHLIYDKNLSSFLASFLQHCLRSYDVLFEDRVEISDAKKALEKLLQHALALIHRALNQEDGSYLLTHECRVLWLDKSIFKSSSEKEAPALHGVNERLSDLCSLLHSTAFTVTIKQIVQFIFQLYPSSVRTTFIRLLDSCSVSYAHALLKLKLKADSRETLKGLCDLVYTIQGFMTMQFSLETSTLDVSTTALKKTSSKSSDLLNKNTEKPGDSLKPLIKNLKQIYCTLKLMSGGPHEKLDSAVSLLVMDCIMYYELNYWFQRLKIDHSNERAAFDMFVWAVDFTQQIIFLKEAQQGALHECDVEKAMQYYCQFVDDLAHCKSIYKFFDDTSNIDNSVILAHRHALLNLWALPIDAKCIDPEATIFEVHLRYIQDVALKNLDSNPCLRQALRHFGGNETNMTDALISGDMGNVALFPHDLPLAEDLRPSHCVVPAELNLLHIAQPSETFAEIDKANRQSKMMSFPNNKGRKNTDLLKPLRTHGNDPKKNISPRTLEDDSDNSILDFGITVDLERNDVFFSDAEYGNEADNHQTPQPKPFFVRQTHQKYDHHSKKLFIESRFKKNQNEQPNQEKKTNHSQKGRYNQSDTTKQYRKTKNYKRRPNNTSQKGDIDCQK